MVRFVFLKIATEETNPRVYFPASPFGAGMPSPREANKRKVWMLWRIDQGNRVALQIASEECQSGSSGVPQAGLSICTGEVRKIGGIGTWIEQREEYTGEVDALEGAMNFYLYLLQ